MSYVLVFKTNICNTQSVDIKIVRMHTVFELCKQISVIEMSTVA